MFINYIHIMTEPPDSSILFNAYKFIAASGWTGPDQLNLNDLSESVDSKDTAVSAVLTKQKQVNNIMQSEINRLNDKKIQLDNAQKGQKRVLMMNESNRRRQSEYISLIIAVVIVFALVIFMRFMRFYFNVLPDSIYTLAYIFLFSGLIIYSFVTYINVNSREKINYDRLDIPAPQFETSNDANERNEAALKKGNLLGVSNSNLCKGAACCTDGKTMWDKTTEKCVVEEVSGGEIVA
jgi:hypothetical protein